MIILHILLIMIIRLIRINKPVAPIMHIVIIVFIDQLVILKRIMLAPHMFQFVMRLLRLTYVLYVTLLIHVQLPVGSSSAMFGARRSRASS